MSDSPTISMNSSWRVFFASVTMVFCGSIILWLIVHGNGDNSLHQSALSWAWFTLLGVLMALGVGPVADAVMQMISKRG